MSARIPCAFRRAYHLAILLTGLSLANAAFAQVCTPPPSGLVGWWKGDGDATDALGANNGTLVNGATFGAGEVGQAFSFNGNSQVMQVVDAPALNPTSALTLECWAKLTAFAGAGVSTTVIEKGGAADAVRQYEIGTVPSAGQHYFQPALWTSGGFQGPVGTTPIVLNTWYHVAITYDGASVKLYVNGNLDCSAAITGPIPVSTHPLWIGGDLEDPYNTTGLVDEVSLYNRALTAAEVQSIYNSGSAGKCITPAAPAITTQPANETIYVGQTAGFSVMGTGLPTPSYQWAHNGTNLAGATGSALVISGAQLTDAGNYNVTLSNVVSSVTSSNAMLTVNPVSCTPPPSGMVGWWKGDGDATDVLGVNNGTLVNGATFGTGEVGQAFSFNGNSQVMQVVDAPALNPTSALTLECWAKLTAFAGAGVSTAVIEKGGAADAVRQYEIGTVPSGGQHYFQPALWTSGGFQGPVGTTPIVLNTWYHVAITYDGASVKLYVNGNLDCSAAITGPIPVSTHPLWIGGDLEDPYNTTGLVDEVSLYNRALTAAEVQSIYNSGSAGKCITPTAPGITAQPTNQTINVGQTAVFSVIGTGLPAPSYQWAHNGTNVAGATGSSLVISGAQLTDAGSYDVTLTNVAGSITSSNAMLTVNPISCTPPPSGLVGWWKGDGNATDALGLNNGTLVNGATFGAGEVGQAFSFNGNSQVMQVVDAPVLNPTAALTLECWAKLTAFAGAGVSTALIEKGGAADAVRQYEIGTVPSGGQHYFQPALWTSGGFQGPVGTTPILLNTWYHVAVTYDGASVKLYVNGNLDCSAAITGSIPVSTHPLWIGGDLEDPYNTTGLVDEVSLYNRALSAAEVQSIFNSGVDGKCQTFPLIILEPTNQTLLAGSTALFTVTAAGPPPLTYQWRFDGTNLAGATASSLSISNVQSANGGNYSVVVANTFGSATSSNAVLTVHTPPFITGLHASTTVSQGSPASFTVTAGGDLPLSYRWQLGGTNIPGATATAYNIAAAQASDAGVYQVVVSNAFGTATSTGSVLTVLLPPSIVTQPASATVTAGANATFMVVASGTPTLFYQWQFNGTVIAGATGSALSLSDVQNTNAGNFSVIVSNAFGSAVSSNALLTVNPGSGCTPPPSGIVGWWPLNGDWTDIIGGDTGTPTGPTNFTTGEVGLAMVFNGSSSTVRIPASSNLNVGIQPGFTVEMWINPTSLAAEQSLLEWNDGNIFGNHMTISTPGRGSGPGSVWGTLNDNIGNYYYLPSPAGLLATNVYQHVAWTYDVPSGISLIYLNGHVIAQTNFGSIVTRTTPNIYLGYRPAGPSAGLYYKGAMDEVGIYDRALTLAEIQAVYNAGSAGKCQAPVPPTIYAQPASQSVVEGSNATFTVGVAGTIPFGYQWEFNGTNLSGATDSSLTVSNAQPANGGNYSVVVSNSVGSVTSSNALLTVTLPPSLIQAVSVTATSGIVTVPINLLSQGDENALGFSVNFNPTLLTFAGVTLGSNASGGSVVDNANLAGQGKIGLLISLPSGATFIAGTQNVANVSFFVAALTSAQTTPVTFGDQPTLRQVVDPLAHILVANYAGGTVTIPAVTNAGFGIEGDVSPSPVGDNAVTTADWVQEGRFVAGLDIITDPGVYQRADCAPRATLGDGHLTVADWVQVGRYALGLDPLTPAGGPSTGNVFNAPSGIGTLDLGTHKLIVTPPSVAVAGQTCRVSIQLVGAGNENAVGFSLNFDPTMLSFSSAGVGTNAGGSLFNVNSYQATGGKLGVALALPAGTAFTSGTNEVAEVTFTVSPAATNTTGINFGDQPVVSQTVDAGANALTTSYVNGALAIAPLSVRPILQLALTPDNSGLVLSWPATAVGFILESSMDPRFVLWSGVNASLVTNSATISATIPLTGAQQFFRLHQP